MQAPAKSPAPFVGTNLSTRNFLAALFAPVAGIAGQYVEVTGWSGGDDVDIPKECTENLANVDLGDADWLDQVLAIADGLAAASKNVHFGVAPRTRRAPKGGRGKAEDVDRVPALWVDIDCPKDKRGNVQAWKNSIRDKIDHAGASAWVDSGHGYHLYFFLDQALTDLERAKALLLRLVDELGGDTSAKNFDRLLRIPGPPNVKRPDKPIATSIPRIYSTSRHSIETLESIWRKRKPPDKPADSPSQRKRTDTGGQHQLSAVDVDRILQSWGDGNRHPIAVPLFGAMRKSGWSEADAWVALSLLIEKGGGSQKDLGDVIRSTWKQKLEDVIGWKGLLALGFADDELQSVQKPRTGRAGEHGGDRERHFTDLGNAKRLVERHGQDVGYAKALGWLVWNGRAWKRDEEGRIHERAKETALSFGDEASDLERQSRNATDEERKHLRAMADELREHGRDSESAARLAAMVTLATTDPGVVARPEDLDADPWAFNVANGTLDLRTGELRPHSRGDLITQISPIEYDAKADAPFFLGKFLPRIMGGDVERMAFLQRVAGYALTGVIRDRRVLFLAIGPPGTGKSRFAAALRLVAGEYGKTPSMALLLEPARGKVPEEELASVRGARFLTLGEAPRGARAAAAIIKNLGGGEPVSARHLYRDRFEFTPCAKIWWGLNDVDRPHFRADDQALWDRLYEVPFLEQIPPEERMPEDELHAIVKRERAGILRWAADGARAWFERGLQPPEAIREATDAYRRKVDRVSDFFEECCSFKSGATPIAKVREAYDRWAADAGLRHPLSVKDFRKRLIEKGAEAGKGANGVRIWHGVLLTDYDGGANGEDGSNVDN